LAPDKYAELFEGLVTRVISEEDLLEKYLKRLGPQLKESAPTDLAKKKWVSLVVAKSPATLRDYGAFEYWPHAAGHLRLNPLYRNIRNSNSGTVELSLQFPSTWYEFENGGCLRYMPKAITVKSDTMSGLKSGARSGEVDTLVEQCVLVGMPERYA
jgi:hypothetical protein